MTIMFHLFQQRCMVTFHPSFWKNHMEHDREHISKDMEAENFLREGLELQGVGVTAMAPLLLKFRREEATIFHSSRGEK